MTVPLFSIDDPAITCHTNLLQQCRPGGVAIQEAGGKLGWEVTIIDAKATAHAIECFGFDRVVFGGDWPVSELASTYRRWVDPVDSIVAGASGAERRRLYRDNAIAFYRL